MPSSPRKGSQPSPAIQVEAGDKAELNTFLPHLNKAQELAELIAAQPERLANPDATISALSLHALKQMFDYSVQSEQASIPSISAFIQTVTPKTGLLEQRASRSAGKRKRGQASASDPPLFEGTPLDELVTDGMNSRQLWEQIDLKAAKMSNIVERFFAQGLIQEEQDQDQDEQDSSKKAGPSRSRSRSDHDHDSDLDDDQYLDDDDMSDEEDFDPEEERVRLSQLSDAELRSIGVDPALRDQFLASLADDADEDEDSDDQDSGYPGASDISDGDPTEIFHEPLKTEAEQLQRKEEQELGMLPRLRSQVDDDEDEQVSEVSEDEEDVDEDDEDSEDEEEQDENKRATSSGNSSAGIPKSLLQDLDRPGKPSQRPTKRHPTLDDDFFSIDELNRQLDEQDAEEDLDDNDDDDHDLTNQVDYFKPLSGDDDLEDEGEEEEEDEEKSTSGSGLVDAADAHYADFFLPPIKAAKFNKKFGKRKASARFADLDAAGDTGNAGNDGNDEDDFEEGQEASPSKKAAARVYEEPDRKRKIRFNDTIEYRRIKPRKKSLDDMLGMIGATSKDLDAAREFDEDMDQDDEDAQEDQDDDEMDMDEVESETSSVGRQGSDDEDEQDEDEEQYSDDQDTQSQGEDAQKDEADEEEDQDVNTARRVAGDLFADSDDEADAQEKLSTHERRQAAIKAEIAQLEDENVSKKDWTLMGEAGSRVRPQDSLLEQDLEFERAAKVTPQVTEEMTESIEDLIKRRILDHNFDDVIRRREMEALPYLPSRLLELSDSKSSKSLAELYEEEYQAARGGGGGDGPDGAPVAEADAKLAKEHGEITVLYDEIFNKLDALSNAHFTPKAPKATIQTLTNAPSVSMETALPSTASSSTMLAPEEVYERQRHSTAMEGAKSEMTPEEKQRLHNKLRHEKKQRNEKIQDTRKALEMSGLVRSKKVNEKEEKQQALKKLVGNRGVSVIGKGEVSGSGQSAKKGKGKGKGKGVNGMNGMNGSKPIMANQFKL
ncbi:related to MPP10 - component of the U3 small nucleolar ribonucleoprotein [Melanopsichium pennsylvanicum]|uniref:Related to MPP10 - component of the U3 small nucleolar ribonucleoprotein n=1 Tax=Melanopsichium pennsylvanicum TaxID=63383 RepID=A0AAJ4XSU4_9BASI|nr:related to MPP10 - component of the U3 small nucleolar ribonucleoprotein [Melanopsichium pennsylvanicum]